MVLGSNGGPSHRRSKAISKSIQESRPRARRRKMIEEDKDLQPMLDRGKQLVNYTEEYIEQ